MRLLGFLLRLLGFLLVEWGGGLAGALATGVLEYGMIPGDLLPRGWMEAILAT